MKKNTTQMGCLKGILLFPPVSFTSSNATSTFNPSANTAAQDREWRTFAVFKSVQISKFIQIFKDISNIILELHFLCFYQMSGGLQINNRDSNDK